MHNYLGCDALLLWLSCTTRDCFLIWWGTQWNMDNAISGVFIVFKFLTATLNTYRLWGTR